MLRITQGKGFQLTFANGWTVSVQFGPTNYCERKGDDLEQWLNSRVLTINHAHESQNAEVAAFDAKGRLYKWDDWDDDVRGWQGADEVAALIAKVAALPAGYYNPDDNIPGQ